MNQGEGEDNKPEVRPDSPDASLAPGVAYKRPKKQKGFQPTPERPDPDSRVNLPLHQRVRDTRGKFLTLSLFSETCPHDSLYEPLYTLQEQDKPGLPSARRIYLDLADPTEYAPAMALLGSWEHWQALCRASWFQRYIQAWRSELDIKLKSRAMEIAKALSHGNDSTALSAAKWLHSQLHPTPKRGRPKTNPIESGEELDPTLTNEDYKRLLNDE